jgi:hypothetical protein
LYFAHLAMPMRIRLIYSIFWLIPSFLIAQENIKEIGVLPDEVSETSGLIFYNDKLITHNDSGNAPELFEIDTVSMQIVRKVTITNAENIDWEDMTQDDTHIYIGDFGNYNGTREDLAIYKISKQEYDQSEIVTAEKIGFSYEDQNEFIDNGRSNWDAEALFSFNDQLVILTKQWIDGGTVAYSLEKTPGTHLAKNIGYYPVNGLVTGATYNPLSTELVVLGHSNILVPFVLKVEGISENSIFEGNIEKIPLDVGFAQTEGIAHVKEDRYLISSEYFTREIPSITLNSLLYGFQFANDNEVEEEENEEEVIPEPEENENKLVLYPGNQPNHVEYELTTTNTVLAQAIFDTSGRMIKFRLGSEIENDEIDITTFKSGLYYLSFYLGDRIISKSFVRK